MPKGISLHIGLNTIDAAAYHPLSASDLVACEFDALDMQSLAKKLGYQSQLLLSQQATYQAVTDAIANAAKQLATGDIFFLTYSGHGSQVRDRDGDEDDGMDETWVLYDRMMTDDELYKLWFNFAKGVRICVLSDSCHSGTVTRFTTLPGKEGVLEETHPRVASGLAVGKKSRATLATCPATGILISGCQDRQVAYDGDRNGLFTSQLLTVWNNGGFQGSYKKLRDMIASRLPRYQSPNYFLFGATTGRTKFARQKPFTI